MNMLILPTTSTTHCGTDLVASQATVVTTLPNHGFLRVEWDWGLSTGSTLIDQLEIYIQ